MLPEILKIGNFSISGYRFFYLLGVLLVATVVIILARKEKFDTVETINLLIFGSIAMFLGSKIYSVVFRFFSNPKYYINDPEKLFTNFFKGGIFYGGLILGVLFFLFYLPRYFKGNEWRISDIIATGVALGHSSGRLGCFSAGCCYGKITSLPWGVKFPFLGGHRHPFSGSYVHPTQLYESVLNLINFLILYTLYKKKRFNGQIVSMYFINYGIIRFFIEFLRNDGGRGYLIKGSGFSLSYPQVISLILILSGVVLYKVRKKKSIVSSHPSNPE